MVFEMLMLVIVKIFLLCKDEIDYELCNVMSWRKCWKCLVFFLWKSFDWKGIWVLNLIVLKRWRFGFKSMEKVNRNDKGCICIFYRYNVFVIRMM